MTSFFCTYSVGEPHRFWCRWKVREGGIDVFARSWLCDSGGGWVKEYSPGKCLKAPFLRSAGEGERTSFPFAF